MIFFFFRFFFSVIIFVPTTQGHEEKDFFLYVSFHDPHRCGHTNPEFGAFCERFGNRDYPRMGVIPDWRPHYYR